MRSLLVLAVLVPTHAFADVDVTAAPAIAAAPDHGVDPDLAERLATADSLLARAQLEHALDAVLVVMQSRDPFSIAQRDRIAPRAAQILTRIGERARASGDLMLAARAFDARWTVTGKTDPDLARALVAWSEHESDPHALYLVRRARRADPDLVAAARRDAELSTNRRAWPGRLMIITAALAFGAGLYADHTGHADLATGLYIATPLLSTGGVLLEVSGTRNYAPSSPRELPALAER